MSTTINGIPVIDLPVLSPVTSGASVVGELSGSGRFNISAISDYLANGGMTSLHLTDLYVTGSTSGTVLSAAWGNGNYSGGAVQLTNNLAPGVNQYVTAFCGYGINNQPGGMVFGLFGRADLNTTGTALNEMDSFNLTGHNPSGVLPPAIDFGSSDYTPIALLLAPFGSAQSAIGLCVSKGGASFQTGIYVWPGSSTLFGIYVDATATTGPLTAGHFRALPTGSAVIAQLMGSPAPSARILECVDPAGTALSWMSANGDISNGGFTLGHDGFLYFFAATVGNTAAGGAAATLPAAPADYLVVSINGASYKIPFYNM
jgi:hypothetical protein